jgi:hypothetical protein
MKGVLETSILPSHILCNSTFYARLTGQTSVSEPKTDV